MVRGILDVSEDRVKIKATEVRALSEMDSPMMKPLHLKIPLSSSTTSQLYDLKEIIRAHQGLCRIFLHLVNGKQRETVIALSEDYTVDPTPEFQSKIENLSLPRRF
jgi:DNA polymerase-3 subunit alpha